MKLPMHKPTLLSALLLIAASTSALRGDELLHRLSWDHLTVTDGRAQLVDDARYGQVLQLGVESTGDASLVLFEIPTPPITEQRYGIVGEVRHQDVEGQGFLEMWSQFGDGRRFFSRTLGSGPLAPLSGSAGWRRFILPFDLQGTDDGPSSLSFGIALPEGGKVWLHGLELRQFAADEDPLAAASGAWWSNRQAAFVGGLGGAGFGILGGLLSWLTARGQGRSFVLTTAAALIAVSLIALISGALAIVLGQPYSVYYPLLLLGGLGVLIMPSRMRAMRQRFTDLELRRIKGHDLMAE